MTIKFYLVDFNVYLLGGRHTDAACVRLKSQTPTLTNKFLLPQTVQRNPKVAFLLGVLKSKYVPGRWDYANQLG